jgi:hypothetical protein
MTAFAVPELDLQDARESLEYWEGRVQRLPRRAVRRRREAREMTQRWRARVVETERAVYGRGIMGALLLVATERRLPEPVRQQACRGRRVVRRIVLLATVAAAAALFTATVAAVGVLTAIV